MAYESAHTQFMREWLQQHPEEIVVQQSGRALWWDRGRRDAREEKAQAAAKVPQKSYYYDLN